MEGAADSTASSSGAAATSSSGAAATSCTGAAATSCTGAAAAASSAGAAATASSTDAAPAASSTAAEAPDSAAAAAAAAPDAAAPAPQDWHLWKRPDVSLRHVVAVGVYVVPAGGSPVAGWAGKCAPLLDACRAFHEAEFPGSRVSWVLRGPLTLAAGALAREGDADAFYDAAANAVVDAADASGTPLPCAASAVAPDAPAPSHVVFVMFADWGFEPAFAPTPAVSGGAAASTPAATPAPPAPAPPRPASPPPEAPLAKYYIWDAAAAQGVDITDIRLTGGSRSSFHGVRKLSEVAGAVAGTPLAASAARAPGTRVGYGVGLVTQEAWYHPEVHGSEAVVYHEGLGHALRMPHPTERQRMCVMDLGMYQQLPLAALCVCDELKADMVGGRDAPLCRMPAAGGGAGGAAAGGSSSNSSYSAGDLAERVLRVVAAAGPRLPGGPVVPTARLSFIVTTAGECDLLLVSRVVPAVLLTPPAAARRPALRGGVSAPRTQAVAIPPAGMSAARLFEALHIPLTPAAPTVLGAGWPETQYVVDSEHGGGGGGGAPVFCVSTYGGWQEVLFPSGRLAADALAPTTGLPVSPAAVAANACYAVLHDPSRGFGLVLAGAASYLCCAGGLWGTYFPFHAGRWHLEPLE